MSRPRRRFASLAIASLALAFLFGCSKPSPSSGSSNFGANGTGGAQSGGGQPAATTSPSAPVSYPTTAGAYAAEATNAWSAGDTTRLAQLTDQAATIWSTLNSGDFNKQFGLYQCTGAAGSSICALYNAVGDELDLQVRNDRIGLAQAVVGGQWHPITFPTDLKAYAQEALDDWGRHNTAAVALLTGKTGDSAFAVVPNGHREDVWTYDHNEGASGHTFYLWRNPAGDEVVIGFLQPGFATVPANRHGLIESVYFTPHP